MTVKDVIEYPYAVVGRGAAEAIVSQKTRGMVRFSFWKIRIGCGEIC
jgi:hypothetical protein